ncbi:MAG: hypothetical protein ACRCSY_08520 [Cetobacterium sp.]
MENNELKEACHQVKHGMPVIVSYMKQNLKNRAVDTVDDIAVIRAQYSFLSEIEQLIENNTFEE